MLFQLENISITFEASGSSVENVVFLVAFDQRERQPYVDRPNVAGPAWILGQESLGELT